MKTCKTTGLALIVLLITAILFTACPNTAGGGNSGAGGGTGGGGGTVPPAPLDGVWKALSATADDGTEVTFPATAPDGTKTQPYFCFWNGMMYDVSEISDSPDPSNDGLYKDAVTDFTFDGTKIFIDEEHELGSVTLSGNTMTLTSTEGEGGSMVLEKTDSPTVQDILDAPGPYVQVPYTNLEAYLATTASSSDVNYIEITGPIPPEAFKGSSSNPGALGQKLKNHSGKKVALKIKTYPEGLTDMRYCFFGCTSLITAPAIPASVTNMNSCFLACTSLTTAPAIPAGVIDMGSCFDSCTGLRTAPAIPANVTDMNFCFKYCESLTTAPAIPAGVTDMSWCFYGCTSLTGVTLKCNYSADNFDDAFTNCTALQNGGIKVPAGQLATYKTNAGVMGTTEEKFAAIP